MLRVEEKKTHCGQQLYQRIPERNPSFTVATLPSKEQERKNRNIIVEFYLLLTVGTGGRGLKKAHPEGQTVDYNVEEASPGKAETGDNDYRFHGIIGVFTSPVRES
jgi:hypothetical protein